MATGIEKRTAYILAFRAGTGYLPGGPCDLFLSIRNDTEKISITISRHSGLRSSVYLFLLCQADL